MKTKKIKVELNKQMAQSLEEYSIRRMITPSQVITEALIDYAKKHQLGKYEVELEKETKEEPTIEPIQEEAEETSVEDIQIETQVEEEQEEIPLVVEKVEEDNEEII